MDGAGVGVKVSLKKKDPPNIIITLALQSRPI